MRRQFTSGDVVAIDYETSGLSVYRGARAFTYVITFCDNGDTEVYDLPEGKARLKELWERADVEKVAHNLKFELTFTTDMGITARGALHDTMILHQMLNNLDRHGLDYVAKLFCTPEDAARWDKLDKDVDDASVIFKKDYSKIPRYVMKPYQAADGERTALLFRILFPLVKKDARLYKRYLTEIELIKTTVRMERVGIMLAEPQALALLDWLNKEVEAVDAAWPNLNLDSPKQLVRVLYEELKLPKLRFTPAGDPSVDAAAIEDLRLVNNHPILDAILKSRSYTKGAAMIRSYLEAAGNDGIIHPTYNTNKARTGRQSCENPNMQNVSKEASPKTRFPVPARRCFRARPKYVLYSMDYSGIEMRLGVQGTGSPRLIKLASEDFDFHDACAKNFYGERYTRAQGSAKKTLRSAAKNARFAMFYGAGIDKVAKTLGLSYYDTKDGYERDRQEYPEFYDFMDSCTHFARRHGYIETYGGRRLRVQEDSPYVATDYCIQGSAAEVLKDAQVSVDEYLIDKLGDEIKMLLCVHDELVFEYPRELFPQRTAILGELKKLMITMPNITVPLNVEAEMTTTTWDKGEEVAL